MSRTIRVPLTVILDDGHIAELKQLAREADIRNNGCPLKDYTPDQAFVVVMNEGEVNPLNASRTDGLCDGWYADPETPWPQDEDAWETIEE